MMLLLTDYYEYHIMTFFDSVLGFNSKERTGNDKKLIFIILA